MWLKLENVNLGQLHFMAISHANAYNLLWLWISEKLPSGRLSKEKSTKLWTLYPPPEYPRSYVMSTKSNFWIQSKCLSVSRDTCLSSWRYMSTSSWRYISLARDMSSWIIFTARCIPLAFGFFRMQIVRK